MSPTQRDALMLACKVLDYAAEVADRPGLMRTCEEAADALRAVLTEPPRREPLTDSAIHNLAAQCVKGGKSVEWALRAIERAHGISGEGK
jgi:hypothetical protein